ncbi:hypothetical protein ACHAXS_008986 [Conticribra weissflogii]
MSGKWRSRFWRDGGAPGTTGDSIGNPSCTRDGDDANYGSSHYGGRDNVNTMDPRENNNHDGQSRIRALEGNDHGNSKFDKYHRPSSSHNSRRRWADMEDDDEEETRDGDRLGEWRRAQPLLPLSPSSNSRTTTRREVNPNPQTEAAASARRATVTVRAAFPRAPAKAWGHNDKVQLSSSLSVKNECSSSQIPKNETAAQEKNHWRNGANNAFEKESLYEAEKSEQKSSGSRTLTPAKPAINKKPNAWGKSDSCTAASFETTTSHAKIIKNQSNRGISPGNRAKSKNSKNPWSTPDTNVNVNASMRSGNSFFPSLADANVDVSGSRKHIGNEAAGTEELPATSATTASNGQSFGKFQLPASAGWGMSSSSKPTAKSSATQQSTKNNNSKVEEFPSLSSALSAPRNPQHKSQITTSSTSHAPWTKELSNNTAKGSKKGQPASSLASFLPPQIQNGKNKKLQPSQQSTTSSTKLTLASKKSPALTLTPKANIGGVKRNAPSSSYSSSVPPSMEKAPYHPAIHTPNNEHSGISSHSKKGRQRIAPRKKKLTTLKKRVLEERLRVWKELHPEEEEAVGIGKDAPSTKRVKRNESSSELNDVKSSSPASRTVPQAGSKSTTLVIENFIRPDEDDLDDEDEYDEIVCNLISLAGRVGKVLSVYIPRPTKTGDDEENEEEGVVNSERKWVGYSFVRFESNKDLRAANDIFDGMIVGGQQIRPSVLQVEEIDSCSFRVENQGETNIIPSAENERQWQQAVVVAMEKRGTIPIQVLTPEAQTEPSEEVSSSSANTVVFHNILCDDDYGDEEALEESIEDIKGLAMQYGPVSNARADFTGSEKGNIYVSFNNLDAARKAVAQLNGMVVGGSKIVVSLHDASLRNNEHFGSVEVVLNNVLNENDLEDVDCLKESIEDISNLAREYGQVGRVYAETSGDRSGMVHIEYLEGMTAAQQAVKELDGMVIGGLIVSATIFSNDSSNDHSTKSASSRPSGAKAPEEEEAPKPMLSGDKIIPERFAACKRVPKIPNAGVPRAYASKLNDERATPILIEMLGELMRLQERNKGDKNARARRRLVMGLREVARGIRARKVKMVVMANNLDEYGAIDSKLQEILDLARAEDVPVIFELNKRKLGKALGKSIKVSVVGVQNSDGAQEQFKKLRKIMGLI